MGRKRGRLRNGVVKLLGRKKGRIKWVCRGKRKERRLMPCGCSGSRKEKEGGGLRAWVCEASVKKDREVNDMEVCR